VDMAFDGARAFRHLKHLAVTLGPRAVGTAGEHRAAAYVADAFRAIGLKVRLQRFPSLAYDNERCTFEVHDGGRWRPLPAEPVLLSHSTPPRGIEGELFFAETGAAAYFSPAMKGKIVLACGPGRPEERLRLITYGPKAIVCIDPTVRDALSRSVLHASSRHLYGNRPMAVIRHLDGLDLVRRGLGRARLILRNRETPSHSLNVVAELPGTDLADEIVVVCAHYDSHRAISGAADNAGGTALLLELARVLAARPTRRTLRFIAFAAEEAGLCGSSYYADRLAREDRRARGRATFDPARDKTECDRHRLTFNLDVHGCLLGRYHATFNGPDDLGASVRLLAHETGVACEVKRTPMSSDGTPLAAVGVPNVQLARYGGTTAFGHQTGDDVRYLAAGPLATAGTFAERYLRRYVTEAPTFAFAREISDDQKKEIRDYFARGGMPVPGDPPLGGSARHRRKP